MAVDELESLALREFDLISQTVQSYLTRSPISHPFKDAIWELLARLSPQSEKLSKSNLTILLPRLSYQACRGGALFPIEISTAWYLFYLAADLMDSLQDQDDQLLTDFNQLSSSEWLNMASSFFFIANALLVEMLYQDYDLESVKSVLRIFQNKLLEMCEGQQRDVSAQEMSLADYLEMLRKKSGSFFSLACYAGARMASKETGCVKGLSDFGTHLGCVIQILDDLEDWHRLQAGDKQILQKMDLGKNLATVYTLEVLPSEEKELLRKVIERINRSPEEWQTYSEWVDRSGAAVFILTILAQEVESARKALHNDLFLREPREALLTILTTLADEI